MAIVGYWRMNGNSNDASGNGLNGTDTNVTYGQGNGVLNGGAGFNGSSSKITLPNSVGINTTFTFSCLAFFNSGADNYSIYCKGAQAPAGDGWGVDTRFSAKYLVFLIQAWNPSPANYIAEPYEGSFSANKWYFITFIFDNSNKYIQSYLNSILYGSKTNVGQNLIGTNNVYFGVNRQPSSWIWYYNGGLDEIKMDNTVWSSAKIKNEYSRIKGFF